MATRSNSKQNRAGCQPNYGEPTYADWCGKADALGLKNVGAQLQGPCPECGGTDRFRVQKKDCGIYCRQCAPDGKADPGFKWRIIHAVFPERKRTARHNPTAKPVAPAAAKRGKKPVRQNENAEPVSNGAATNGSAAPPDKKLTEASTVDEMVRREWHKRHVSDDAGWWHLPEAASIWDADPKGHALTEEVRQTFQNVGKPKLCTGSRIRGVIGLAASNPCFRQRITFDADPELIGLADGTVLNLQHLDVLDDGDAALMHVSKRLAVTPDSTKGKPERWLKFLHEVLPSEEDVEWLRLFLGYCLTGYTEQHQFAYFYGKGRNGKGVLVETLRKIFGGDYHQRVAGEKMLANSKGGNSAHLEWLAALLGKRLITADELPASAWSVHRLKQLVAGDMQTANFMRRNSFQFAPVGKFILIGNEMPKIVGGAQYAIAERIRIIRFPNTFPPENRDAQLAEALRAEMPQIAWWLCEAAGDYCTARCLLPPTASMKAHGRMFADEAGGPFKAWAGRLHYSPFAWTKSENLVASARGAGLMVTKVSATLMEAMEDASRKVPGAHVQRKKKKLDGRALNGVQGVALEAQKAQL